MTNSSNPTDRISTGIEGLDQILRGGLVRGKIYALVGAPGSGKTILTLQIMQHQAKQGKHCAYLSILETGQSIESEAHSLGMSMDGVQVIPLRNAEVGKDKKQPEEYRIFSPSEVEKDIIWKNIVETIEKHKPDILAIDNISILGQLSIEPFWYHRMLLHLTEYLSENGVTSILHANPKDIEQDRPLAQAVDGVLILHHSTSSDRIVGIRDLEVIKTRCSNFMSGRHSFRITNKGLSFFPHDIENKSGTNLSEHVFHMGNETLDAVLGGGIESGTGTLITGPSGVGKSVLGMQILASAANAGVKTALYSFEESLESMLMRSRNLGLVLDRPIEEGTLNLRFINPMQFYPDEFLHTVHTDTEQGVKLVMVDSIRGYMLAMDQFGSLVAHIKNLVLHLRAKGITGLFINEQENLTGNLSLSGTGVSYMSDNIILMRFAENEGKIIRVFCCMKKRLSKYQAELREFKIGEGGISLGEVLGNVSGLLTGIPALNKE